MKDVLLNLIYIVITGTAVTIAKYVVSLVNKKINEIQISTEIKEYEKLNQYIDSAQEAISNAVLTVTQTYVETLKKNQKFDEAAQIEAKDRAVAIAKDLITEECRNAIIVVYADFDEFLDSAIESLVQLNK